MLNVVSLDKAVETVNGLFTGCRTEETELGHSLGRVLAEDIVSAENVPAFDRSTVDGYAVKASSTYGSSESMPAMLEISGEISMGSGTGTAIAANECMKIPTGGMLPSGADAAVMVEHTECDGTGLCLVYKSVSPFENVTKTGDDVKKGETVLKKGTVLTPRVIGVLAAMGKSTVKVIKQPTAGIISTGDELVDIDTAPLPGQVRDVNSHMLASLCEQAGARVRFYGIIGDDRTRLLSTLQKAAAECDTVLLSGGSSAGEKDMTSFAVGQLGEVLVHGIAVKPGKPTVIGTVGGKAVFGLPGHPAAAYFAFINLVRPLLYMLGGKAPAENTEKRVLSANVSSNNGREEFVCVRLDGENAVPVFSKSGVISLLSKTDGYIVIGRNSEGLKAGEEVTVHLF